MTVAEAMILTAVITMSALVALLSRDLREYYLDLKMYYAMLIVAAMPNASLNLPVIGKMILGEVEAEEEEKDD